MGRKSKKLSELILGNSYVKDVWAEYADKTLIPKYYVSRFDDKRKHRFYYFTVDGNIVISAGVTTVFNTVSLEREAIDQWKENNSNWKQLLNISSEFGTLEHIVYGDILWKKKIDKQNLVTMQQILLSNGGDIDMPIKDVLAFYKFREDYQLIPLLIEASLAYQDPITGSWLTMTIDLLAKMVVTTKVKKEVLVGQYIKGDKKGQDKYETVTEEITEDRTVIIDFKSNFFDKSKKSFYEVHKMQLMAAKLAVEQNFDLKVDGVYNYAPNSWHTQPSYTLYEHKLTDEDWVIYNAYWNLAQVKKINIPSGKFLLADNPKDSTDFRILNYEEYVKEKLIKKDDENIPK